jgi:hypothetical protein
MRHPVNVPIVTLRGSFSIAEIFGALISALALHQLPENHIFHLFLIKPLPSSSSHFFFPSNVPRQRLLPSDLEPAHDLPHSLCVLGDGVYSGPVGVANPFFAFAFNF